MGIIPYIAVVFVWLVSFAEGGVLAYVDAVVIALVLLGIHKPYAVLLSVVFVLGICTDVIVDTTFGVHSVVYMLASVLWLSGFYNRYAKYISGYYVILSGFIMATQMVFGIERYIVLWEVAVIFEYAIKGVYTASLAVVIDMMIPRPTIELATQIKET